MNTALPSDQQELAWLTAQAIEGHCSIASSGQFTLGYGVWYTSSASHLLSEIAHSRNLTYSGTLLPMLGALSTLDQYGQCYEPTPPVMSVPLVQKNTPGVVRAAHHFLGIPFGSDDCRALYALRNGLMHQSSLISVGQGAKPNHFWFEIDNSIAGLFSHAATPWDGAFNTRQSQNRTLVNASKVVQFGLDLPRILKGLHDQGRLKILLKNGLTELLTSHVNLDFEVSIRASYLRYIGELIYRTLPSHRRGPEAATKLAAVDPNAQKQAAQWLETQLAGQALDELRLAFPR